MRARFASHTPHALLFSLCLGIAAANAFRVSHWLVAAAVVCALLAAAADTEERAVLLALALLVSGWWWGSIRLGAIDRSPLATEVGRAARSRLVVTGPARHSRFALRLPGRVVRFGDLRISETVQLELPPGRAPPQGAVLEALVVLQPPRGPERGFDERAWLRRRGIHVVAHVDEWHVVGRRGGIAGFADGLRRHIATALSAGAHGDRRGVLLGVAIGEDEDLPEELRNRFRASGLYHLLAVSGQNVALVAGGVLMLAWILGVPRLAGQVGALAAIAAYVLAVGPQPSVIRAGVAGMLGCLAWICARERDRWWFLLLGALALLAWNPYTLLDAGFQLSFAAVAAIFVLAPRLARWLEGYPIPRKARSFLAVSTACGLATAPLLWWQFHAIPVLAIPANCLAAPAVAPLLGLALLAAAVHPLAPGAATVLAWLAGLCAAYLSLCARTFGGLPFAQIRSGWIAAALGCGVACAAAYAWHRRWRTT